MRAIGRRVNVVLVRADEARDNCVGMTDHGPMMHATDLDLLAITVVSCLPSLFEALDVRGFYTLLLVPAASRPCFQGPLLDPGEIALVIYSFLHGQCPRNPRSIGAKSRMRVSGLV
jgi:hypothetical protein